MVAYNLLNIGAGIQVTAGQSTRILMKHMVRELSLINQTKIKIYMGDWDTVYITFHQVTDPYFETPLELLAWLNGIITDCVCCDCGSPLPVP